MEHKVRYFLRYLLVLVSFCRKMTVVQVHCWRLSPKFNSERSGWKISVFSLAFVLRFSLPPAKGSPSRLLLGLKCGDPQGSGSLYTCLR